MWILLSTLVATPSPDIPLSAFLDRNLFGVRRTARPPNPDPDPPCQPGPPPARLLATLVGDREEAWFATEQGPVLRRVGETIEGARLREIGRMYVRFDVEGACRTVTMNRPPPRALPPSVPPVLKVRRLGNGEVGVSRRAAEAIAADPLSHATSARIVPAIRDGRPVGFKLQSVRAGVLRDLGFKRGDVFRRVNGHDLTDPGGMFGLYGQLLDGEQVTVDFLRRGQKKTLTIRLQ